MTARFAPTWQRVRQQADSHLCFLAWLDRSRAIARSTALGVAFSFFGGFVIVYNELQNDLSGRLDLDFGGIDCEFGGLSPLASISVKR